MAKPALVWLFVALLVVHGLIHLLGFVKGFGLLPVEALKQPITRAAGALWLVAALLWLASALAFVAAPRAWWMMGVLALVLSQGLIVVAWSDAKFGTVANAIVLVPLVLAIVAALPSSLPSQFSRARDEDRRAARAPARTGPITRDELASLPAPVRTWLEGAGVVGRARPRGVVATMRGAMRNGADAPWMPSTFTQQNTFAPHARVFFLEASMKGVPFAALHAYRGAHATMQVRVLGLKQIIDARGPEMDRSETVTMLNDLVVLAPAAVVDAGIVWEPIDDTRVRATFSNAGNTVSAVLTFQGADLVGFVSEDRMQSADGKTYRRLPWSTPLRAHATFDGVRLPAQASALWLDPAGDLEYARFTVESVTAF